MSGLQIIITLVTAIVSGILGSIITLVVNEHRQKLHRRQALVDDIFGYRYQLSSSNRLDLDGIGLRKALNRIVVIFNDKEDVLKACDNLYDILAIKDEQDKKQKADDALITLLKEMCKVSKIKCENWNDSRFTRVFS